MSSTAALLQTINSSWQIVHSAQTDRILQKIKGEGRKIQADDNRSHQKEQNTFHAVHAMHDGRLGIRAGSHPFHWGSLEESSIKIVILRSQKVHVQQLY